MIRIAYLVVQKGECYHKYKYRKPYETCFINASTGNACTIAPSSCHEAYLQEHLPLIKIDVDIEQLKMYISNPYCFGALVNIFVSYPFFLSYIDDMLTL